MAKDPLVNPNLFAKTAPAASDQAQPELTDGTQRRKRNAGNPIISRGIGLRKDTWVKFGDIAEQLGTGYHDLAVYVLTDFMARWDAGYRPPTEQKTVLKR